MLNKWKLILISLILLIFFQVNVYASGPNLINGHKSIDGTISFLVPDSHRLGMFNFNSVVGMEVHKVIGNNRQYYFLRAWANGKKASTNVISGIKISVDGNVYDLKPLEGGIKPPVDQGIIQELYSLNDEMIKAFATATEVKVTMVFSKDKPSISTMGADVVASIGKLAELTSKDYVREGSVVIEEKMADKNAVWPQIFIPGAKPTDLGPALVVQANYFNLRDKYEYIGSGSYWTRAKSDWTELNFERGIRFSFGNDNYPFIWAKMIPINSGTMITAKVYEKSYSGNETSYYEIGYDADNAPRKETYSWMEQLMSLYEKFHGKYDYGFEWEHFSTIKEPKKAYEKRWKRGPYIVTALDKMNFPELEQLQAGDTIVSVNGIPTTKMIKMDIDMCTKYSGDAATFMFRNAAGKETMLTIHPKFRPSNQNKVDYLKIIGNMPRMKIGDTNNPAEVRSFYDPLNNRN